MPPTAASRPSERVTTFSAERQDRHQARQRGAEQLRRDAVALRPGGVHDETRRDVQRVLVRRSGRCDGRLRSHVDAADAADAAAVDERGVGTHVGRDHRPLRRRRLGEGQRDALAVQHLPVLPGDAAGDARRVGQRIEREIRVAAEDPRALEVQRAIDALVAVAGQQVVGAEVGAEGEAVARERAQGRRHEGQRPHQVRGDAQQGAPLAHVLAQLVERAGPAGCGRRRAASWRC